MLKLITSTMLTSAMVFAWDVIHTAGRGVERSEAIGIIDPEKPYAGFAEKAKWQISGATVRTGEKLERGVNWFAMKLGYSDGEVSGMVAWPALAH
jgi:hypothetical protein